MRVQVRLFASLRGRLPEAPRGRGSVELEDGASLQDLLETLEIPAAQAQMVLVDGQKAPRGLAPRAALLLKEGSTVSIFPPLAGG